MTYVRATGKYERMGLGSETLEQFCKRKCFEAGAPTDSFDDYDNWEQLFHDHYENQVVCADGVYRLFDIDEKIVGIDYGSEIRAGVFDIIYQHPRFSLTDAFVINK